MPFFIIFFHGPPFQLTIQEDEKKLSQYFTQLQTYIQQIEGQVRPDQQIAFFF
jgi:hypothetical protein